MPGGDANTVNLLLMPGYGDYEIPEFVITNSTPTSRVLKLRSYDPTNPATLRYAFPTNDLGGSLTNMFTGAGWETWMLNFTLGGQYGLAGFEARDLILDANWTTWAQPCPPPSVLTAATPVWVDGFKLGALHVRGKTGLMENVKVKNYGANGFTPKPYWRSAGVEVFPLWVDGTLFVTSGPPVWVIQDCEVSGFHSTHDGYCTAIMVNTPNAAEAGSCPTQRVAAVRRCQVRCFGQEIGLGCASSAGVVFSDNVVLGAAVGLNNDTALQRNIDLTNNIFLDVSAMANVGGPLWSPPIAFTNYNISWNAVRLRHVPLCQNYSDLAWKTNVIGTFTNLMPVTDPALTIGRFATGWCAGLRIGGATLNRFETNRFTTRPFTNFFEPNPTNTALAKWRPLWRPIVDADTFLSEDQTGSVTNTGNLLSAVAFDFAGLTQIQTPTDQRPALSANPPDFVPGGFPGRVVMETNGAGQLLGVYEVSMADPVLTNGQVEVKARLVFHPSSVYGNNQTEVRDPVNLMILVRGAENPYAYPVSIISNIVTFRYTPGITDGRDEVLVYLGPLQGGEFDEEAYAWSSGEILLGTTLRFERTPDVADDRRLTYGTVRISRSGSLTNLSFSLRPAQSGYVARPATPDGDEGADYELRTSTGSLISRTDGCWPVTLPAGAKEVILRVQPKAGTEDVLEYEAAYLQIVLDATRFAVAPAGPWTTCWNSGYAANSAAVTLWDGPLYRLFGLSDSYPCDGGGSGSAMEGAPPEAGDFAPEAVPPDSEVVPSADSSADTPSELFLPRPTRLPLDPAELDPEAAQRVEGPVAESDVMTASSSSLNYYSTAAFAVNSLVNPAIGGYALYYNGSCPSLPGPYFTLGGIWVVPTYDDLLQVGSPWGSPVVYGVDQTDNMVGSYNSKPCYIAAGTSNVVTLPSLTAGQNGEALWLAPTSNKPVGWSYRQVGGVNYARPTRWQQSGGSWQAVDLGSFDGSQTTPGYAYMANDAGVTVGKTRWPVGSASAWRAFRTSDLITSTNQHELVPPRSPAYFPELTNNVANGLNATGDAVGGSDYWYNRSYGSNWKVETRAFLWWAGSQEAILLPTLQPIAADVTKVPGRSEALAVSRTTGKITIVGSSWATPTGAARAFIVDVYDTQGLPMGWRDVYTSYCLMLNLNDPHLTVMPAGWTMTTAEAINDNGWIVGNGTGPGNSQGYVLVPQSVAGQ